MSQEVAQKLTEYLQNRVGDGLRTVVVVQDDDSDIRYLRDDLRDGYTGKTFTKVVDTFRLEQPFMSPGVASQPVGERRAIVHYHENAFVIQFPVSETASILISLTRETGRDLLDFIEKCRQIVHEAP